MMIHGRETPQFGEVAINVLRYHVCDARKEPAVGQTTKDRHTAGMILGNEPVRINPCV